MNIDRFYVVCIILLLATNAVQLFFLNGDMASIQWSFNLVEKYLLTGCVP